MWGWCTCFREPSGTQIPYSLRLYHSDLEALILLSQEGCSTSKHCDYIPSRKNRKDVGQRLLSPECVLFKRGTTASPGRLLFMRHCHKWVTRTRFTARHVKRQVVPRHSATLNKTKFLWARNRTRTFDKEAAARRTASTFNQPLSPVESNFLFA